MRRLHVNPSTDAQPSCITGKKVYRTHRKAIVALDRLRAAKRRMIWPFRRTERRTYHCQLCGYWHLTSQTFKRKDAA